MWSMQWAGPSEEKRDRAEEYWADIPTSVEVKCSNMEGEISLVAIDLRKFISIDFSDFVCGFVRIGCHWLVPQLRKKFIRYFVRKLVKKMHEASCKKCSPPAVSRRTKINVKHSAAFTLSETKTNSSTSCSGKKEKKTQSHCPRSSPKRPTWWWSSPILSWLYCQ